MPRQRWPSALDPVARAHKALEACCSSCANGRPCSAGDVPPAAPRPGDVADASRAALTLRMPGPARPDPIARAHAELDRTTQRLVEPSYSEAKPRETRQYGVSYCPSELYDPFEEYATDDEFPETGLVPYGFSRVWSPGGTLVFDRDYWGESCGCGIGLRPRERSVGSVRYELAYDAVSLTLTVHARRGYDESDEVYVEVRPYLRGRAGTPVRKSAPGLPPYDDRYICLNFELTTELDEVEVVYSGGGGAGSFKVQSIHYEASESQCLGPKCTEEDEPRLLVALTFDDGPSTDAFGGPSDVTAQVLQILKSHDIPGTFFLDRLKILADKGDHLASYSSWGDHELAIHSVDPRVSHRTYLITPQLGEQILATRQLILERSGQTARYVRPPCGRGSMFYFLRVGRVSPDCNGDKPASVPKLKSPKERLEYVTAIESQYPPAVKYYHGPGTDGDNSWLTEIHPKYYGPAPTDPKRYWLETRIKKRIRETKHAKSDQCAVILGHDVPTSAGRFTARYLDAVIRDINGWAWEEQVPVEFVTFGDVVAACPAEVKKGK